MTIYTNTGQLAALMKGETNMREKIDFGLPTWEEIEARTNDDDQLRLLFDSEYALQENLKQLRGLEEAASKRVKGKDI